MRSAVRLNPESKQFQDEYLEALQQNHKLFRVFYLACEFVAQAEAMADFAFMDHRLVVFQTFSYRAYCSLCACPLVDQRNRPRSRVRLATEIKISVNTMHQPVCPRRHTGYFFKHSAEVGKVVEAGQF